MPAQTPASTSALPLGAHPGSPPGALPDNPPQATATPNTSSKEGQPAGTTHGEQVAAETQPYQPLRPARSLFVPVRGWRYHLQVWGDASQISAERPLLLMAHGFMDVGASFQFVVDELARREGPVRCIVAPDWRGFGHSHGPAQDDYTFADYLGDLDGLLDALGPALASAPVPESPPVSPPEGLPKPPPETPPVALPVDLLGHSMGGNIVMSYAGVRPQRVRRLVNIEGFGLPRSRPEAAPKRLAQWLDALKTPAELRTYASLAEVAQRLRKTNHRLRPDRAAWLAGQWAQEERPAQEDGRVTGVCGLGDDSPGAANGAGQAAQNGPPSGSSPNHPVGPITTGGAHERPTPRWHLLADPAHRRPSATPYQVDEVLATWRAIQAPLLWVEGDETELSQWWGDRYPRADFDARLAQVPQVTRHRLSPSGHMVHHNLPEALAEELLAFLAP